MFTPLRRVAVALVIAVAAIGSSFAIAAPANAVVSHIVGHPGTEARCYNGGYAGCLYYDTNVTNDSYAPFLVSDVNLGDNYFTGPGAGAGQVVRNNSNFMACTVHVGVQCTSFWGTNYTGNFDYENSGNIGQLWYTINDNASLWLT